MMYEEQKPWRPHEEHERFKYDFETYIRPYDGVEVEATTGVPADEYIPFDSVKDTL